MKVLITGGAGFIGRALAAKLRSLAHTVHVIDKAEGHHFKLDVSDPWALPVASFDALVHLAAFPSVVHTNSQRAYRDVLATEHTVKAAGKKKIIFASSAAVYGNRKGAIVGDPLCPLGYYAWSKVMGEHLVAQAPNCSILRLCNIYGGDDTRGVWAKFQKARDAGQPAMIYGDGTALRTYCHVDQVVIEIIAELKKPCGIRNITGEDWTVNEIADKVGCDTIHCPPFVDEAIVNTVR